MSFMQNFYDIARTSQNIDALDKREKPKPEKEKANSTDSKSDKCTSLEVCRISIAPNNADALNRIVRFSFKDNSYFTQCT